MTYTSHFKRKKMCTSWLETILSKAWCIFSVRQIVYIYLYAGGCLASLLRLSKWNIKKKNIMKKYASLNHKEIYFTFCAYNSFVWCTYHIILAAADKHQTFILRLLTVVMCNNVLSSIKRKYTSFVVVVFFSLNTHTKYITLFGK